MKILVVEDNAESRYFLQHFLSSSGHDVITANDGNEALASLRTVRPDAIISDALMPGMDGFQFCRAVKQHPEFYLIPFIFYTATFTDTSDEQFALRIGADRFIVKPVVPDELLAMLQETVAKANASPPSAPLPPELDASVLEEYSRRLSVKLEMKVAELQEANSELRNSEQSVRQLNDRLLSTVSALEQQVCERQAAEAALRVREELLRRAQSLAHIGSWEREVDKTDLLWSDEMYRIFGVEPGSVTPTFAWLISRVQADERESFSRELRAKEEQGTEFEKELRITRPDGSVRQVFVRMQLMRDNVGKALRYVGLIEDITDRMQAEAQRFHLEAQLRQAQKMEAIGNLAGGIAHDFNNILTAIMAHGELLELEMPQATTGHMRESVAEIVKAAGRARDLVKQILTFSRKQTVEKRRLVLSLVVQDALKLVRAALPAFVEICIDLKGEHTVLANEAQIHQILLNLCTNAAHSMGDRGGLISVSLAPASIDELFTGRRRTTLRPGEYLRLEVKDNGRGMDSVTLERIFEPFFTTKPLGQGTGLGLAVVHGIVQTHEGAIFVESELGGGTTFAVYFPIATGNAPRPFVPSAEMVEGRGQKILFVDDEPSVAKIGARLLERLGYVATAMTDAVSAKDRLVASPYEFDLVITDYLMPRVTGLDLAKAVWAVRPELPMILAVGFGGQLDAKKARAHGFREFLPKPFALKTLADALDKALK